MFRKVIQVLTRLSKHKPVVELCQIWVPEKPLHQIPLPLGQGSAKNELIGSKPLEQLE